MSHEFTIRTWRDDPRVELLSWLQQQVGSLTSHDPACTYAALDRWRGEGWWMTYSTWYGRFTISFNEDADAILFKLSWPNAVETEKSTT
jgi:hypothetical protein